MVHDIFDVFLYLKWAALHSPLLYGAAGQKPIPDSGSGYWLGR